VVDIEWDRNTAYCALGTGNAIAIVNLADRENPELVATHPLGGEVTSIDYDGDVLYAGVAGVGLVSLEVVGDTLVEVDTLSLTATPQGVFAWNQRVYIVGPTLGLVLADSSLGTDLLRIASHTLAGAESIMIKGDVVYVGRGTQGFTSVDASACSSEGTEIITSFIPAAARSRGAAGTFWLTDMAIANLGRSVVSVKIEYLPKRKENTDPVYVTDTLAVGQQLLINDVFNSLFGLGKANGALRITATLRDVRTTSRTYNAEGAVGTYGQFIPALTSETAVMAGKPGALIQLQQNASFRTNVGVVNLTNTSVDLEIHLYSGDYVKYGVKAATLRPYEMDQFDKIFDDVGAGTVNSGYAMVKVLTQGGKVLAYASVVDNASGDPVYVAAQPIYFSGVN